MIAFIALIIVGIIGYSFYLHNRIISNEDLFIVYLARTRHMDKEFMSDLICDVKDMNSMKKKRASHAKEY